MKLIYLSTGISDDGFKRLVEECPKGTPTYSGIGFDYRIWKALSRIIIDAKAYTYLPIPKSFVFEAEHYSEKEITVIQYNNKSVLKEWSFIHSAEKMIGKEIENTDEDVCILLSGLYRVFVFTALRLKRKFPSITVVGIVPDMPDMMSNYYGKGSIFHQIKMKFDSCYGSRQKKQLDGYVFLAKAMNQIINISNKPYAIMEGLIDDFEIDVLQKKENPRTIVYAGKIGKRFGVVELVEAFLLAEIDNCILHLYGNGDAIDDVKQLAFGHDNIVVHGIQPHNVVINAEREATFLVEPRNPNEDFCSYCFPSKVLEYMSTGTPVIMAPLPNMDNKFMSLFIPVNSYSIENLSQVLKNSLSEDIRKSERIGRDAQLFIKNNMTSSAQAMVINNVINESIRSNNKTT